MRKPPEKLGRDGHPKLGDFIPDLGLPRRMWAGGEVQFFNEVILGVHAKKISTIESVERKLGRTGPLAFVTEKIDIIQKNKLCIREYKKLVYQQEFKKDAKKKNDPITNRISDEEKKISFNTTPLA